MHRLGLVFYAEGRRKHHISSSNLKIDLFLVGPACVDLSRLKTNRSEFAGCYVPDESGTARGSSGHTYVAGMKKTVELLHPSMIWYENVKTAAERCKIPGTNEWAEPPVEARLKLDAKLVLPFLWSFYLLACFQVVRRDMANLGYTFA